MSRVLLWFGVLTFTLLSLQSSSHLGAAVEGADSGPQESMYSIFVTIEVKPEHLAAFREASLIEARLTVAEEPGVVQFHVLQDEEDPNRFYWFEIFEDEAALEAHWETENFITYWDRIQPMLDGPPERLATMRTIFPSVERLRKQKSGPPN